MIRVGLILALLAALAVLAFALAGDPGHATVQWPVIWWPLQDRNNSVCFPLPNRPTFRPKSDSTEYT